MFVCPSVCIRNLHVFNIVTNTDYLLILITCPGNTKMLIIAVFVNEMIEELWLTSGYWGFTLDPPMDMEARSVLTPL